ncbi:efflux RND transporter periplasmic adaptor subunit (plasmid) [Peteryoungia desertarenae]|uniref:Efflux RND transporter periplasmic adaptor subunit n=1 Tax=Peteryoungia desertarenae TaxID=1813451 RepID=A0ABX6QSH4_9HYPH|nr:efflux RND transporter periplasmic adaptor subunit [Peteryoungia desertarenae]QLF71606.1 efflux RND transporter periplasmic adaptor subunit [Peteryoungia desertarenae]
MSALPMPRARLVDEPASGKARLPARGLFIRILAVLLIFVGGAFLGAYPSLPFFPGSVSISGKNQPVPATDTRTASATHDDGTTYQGEGSVIALGRLQPKGKTIIVAAPFGASDARIASLLVDEGDRVVVGQVLAELDSLPSLQRSVETAIVNISAKEAALAQTKATVAANLLEAEASRDRALAAVQLARQALDRERSLSQGGASSRSVLQSAEATLAQSMSDLAKAKASIARYQSAPGALQSDIAVAERNLDLAKAELATARDNLSKGLVVSPISGTVIAINSRPGERPSSAGIMTLGNTDQMQVELEIYQTDVKHVATGQEVLISSPALSEDLSGAVTFIGHEVEQQTVLSADPAANTDARVIRVTADLDSRSSSLAGRLTGLEVVGRVAVGSDHE